jgi:putative intracellular protease/amidase
VVSGLRVNSFTNAEETAVGLDAIVPFLLETRLRELGGRFESADSWRPFAVRDGRLITGQNPQSSERVARALLEALDLAGTR